MHVVLVGFALTSAWATACGDPDIPDLDDPELQTAQWCEDCDDGGGSSGPPTSSSSSSSSSSGGAQGPDLQAIKTLSTHCARNAWGQLVIKVRNAGTTTAGSSTTRVTWGNGAGVQNFPTASIGAGATRKLYVNMPMACFGPAGDENCSFTLTVDANNAVSESSETNNTSSVDCPGG
jgi:hypothetical protein